MKKLLIILIAILTLLALTLTIVAGSILASRKEPQSPLVSEPTELTEAPTAPPLTEAPAESTVETTQAPTAEPTVSHIEEETRPSETTAPTESLEFEGVTFRPVSRKVYATARANVRTGPAVKYSSIGKLESGGSVEQIGIGDNGWSRIWFQGQKAYVASQYLVTEPPRKPQPPAEHKDPTDPLPPMEDRNDTVYSTGSLNVRSGPGTDYRSIGYLKKGQEARRVAVTRNGWSKIRYNNGYGYVSNNYLETEKTKDPVYTAVQETVYATDNLNLRSGPSVNHKISAKLKKGESILRTAVGDNGWSEVHYQGSRLYASSKYLTKTPPEGAVKPTDPTTPTQPSRPQVQFKDVDDYMVLSDDVTLRSGPGSEYSSMGSLSKGRLVHRTAISDNGWSRILLDGRKAYVPTALLQKEKNPEPTKPADPPRPEPPAQEEEGYVKNEKTVYSTGHDVNIREKPSTDAKKVGKLGKGAPIQRLAVGDDGWSQVKFQDQKAYVKSSFLSEEAPKEEPQSPGAPEGEEIFQDVKDTVYSLDSLNVREAPDFDAKSLGTLYYGDSIQRTGIGSKGWSRVLWDGKTAYVYSKYVTTEAPEMPDFGDTTTPGFPTPNSPFIYQYVDEDGTIPHGVFLPAAFEEGQSLPVIISLHGGSEVGKDREFMEQQHLMKLFREWEYTKLKPINALVITPHLHRDSGLTAWTTKEAADAIFDLIDYLDKNYDIDRNRIILEGHSTGAQGALYLAADKRAAFQKLVLISSPELPGVDLTKIRIPVKGCVGGPGPDGPMENPQVYSYMQTIFKDHFGQENLFVGPYTHEDAAVSFLKKDDDEDGRSDIIDWMLK